MDGGSQRDILERLKGSKDRYRFTHGTDQRIKQYHLHRTFQHSVKTPSMKRFPSFRICTGINSKHYKLYIAQNFHCKHALVYSVAL
jgi:hypothetical protein